MLFYAHTQNYNPSVMFKPLMLIFCPDFSPDFEKIKIKKDKKLSQAQVGLILKRLSVLGTKGVLQEKLKRQKNKEDLRGFKFFKRKNIHNLFLKYKWRIKEEQKTIYTEIWNTMVMGGNQLMGCFHTVKKIMHSFQRHFQISLPSKSSPLVSRSSSEQTHTVFCFPLAPL